MAHRAFEQSIEINAPTTTVWDLVGDVENAPQWSNTATAVKALGGKTRNGTIAVNVNKHGMMIWPTASRVVDYIPGARLANQVINGTVWVFELEEGAGGPGTTRLTEYYEAPAAIEKFWGEIVPKLTKGAFRFTTIQETGVSDSLTTIKRLAEERVAGGSDAAKPGAAKPGADGADGADGAAGTA